MKTRFVTKADINGIHLEATGKATLNRFAKAQRFLSTVHSKASGVRRMDASREIVTAPHPPPPPESRSLLLYQLECLFGGL